MSLPEADFLSVPNEEDEEDIDETVEDEDIDKESSILPLPVSSTDASVPVRPWSDFSLVTPSISTKRPSSRSYRFVQLEKALISAKLLENYNDKIKFSQDYRESMRENKYEEFLQIYYKKLQNHYEQIQQENYKKTIRTFTFVDLEKNFLALDPTRDIKILFIDDPVTASTRKMTYAQ